MSKKQDCPTDDLMPLTHRSKNCRKRTNSKRKFAKSRRTANARRSRRSCAKPNSAKRPLSSANSVDFPSSLLHQRHLPPPSFHRKKKQKNNDISLIFGIKTPKKKKCSITSSTDFKLHFFTTKTVIVDTEKALVNCLFFLETYLDLLL